MLEARDRAAVAVVGSRMYVCGGESANEVLSSSECLDATTYVWASLPPTLKKRSDAVAASIGGRVYVCGGENQQHFMNSVERTSRSSTLSGTAGLMHWEATPPMLE